MSKMLKSLIAAMGVAALAAPILADQPQDAYTTSKVKIELMKSDGLDPLRINVDTFDGVVTLHGQVDSAADSMRQTEKAVSELQHLTGLADQLQETPAILETDLRQVLQHDD